MERFFFYKMKIAVTAVLMVFAHFAVFGQAISKPILNGSIKCNTDAEKSDNDVTAIVTGFPAGTLFLLELSNPNGSFTSGTIFLGNEETAVGGEVNFLNFDFPALDGTGEALGSENYRFQIVEKSGSERSQSSSAFASYYFSGDSPLLSPSGTLCQIQDLTAIDEFDEYVWYKDDVLISGQSGRTLNVTEEGEYFYTPNLGSCSIFIDEAKSNIVTVLVATEIPVSITANGATSFCASESVVLQSDNSDPNIRHQWTKDGVPIPGATNTSFTVTGIDSEGTYRVEIYDITLSIGDRCTSSSNSIDIDLLNPSIKMISESVVFLIPGTQQVLEVETEGANQLITWMLNGIDIPNSNTNTLQIDTPGTYTARLEASSSCIDNGPFTTEDSVSVQSPDSITTIIAYDNPDYDDCELDQVILEISEIRVGSGGEEVIIPENNYQFLSFEWINSGSATGDIDSTILIDNPSENGDYILRVTYDGVDFDSNELPVVLNAGSFEIQQSTEAFTIGTPMNLFVELADGAIVSDYKFQWLANNNVLNGENESQLTITNTGSYTVRIEYDSCPEVTVGPIVITAGSAVIPNIITPNGDGINDNWVLTSDFTQNEEVEINIYASNGELDYSTSNYDGEWPQESKSKAVGTIYYYVISKNNNPVEQGSITIIR